MHLSCEDGWEGEINQRRVIQPLCRGLCLEPASVPVLVPGDSRSAGGMRVVRPMLVFGVGLPDCSLGVFSALGAQGWLWSHEGFTQSCCGMQGSHAWVQLEISCHLLRLQSNAGAWERLAGDAGSLSASLVSAFAVLDPSPSSASLGVNRDCRAVLCSCRRCVLSIRYPAGSWLWQQCSPLAL